MDIKDNIACTNIPTDDDLLRSGLTQESLDQLSNNKGNDEEEDK